VNISDGLNSDVIIQKTRDLIPIYRDTLTQSLIKTKSK